MNATNNSNNTITVTVNDGDDGDDDDGNNGDNDKQLNVATKRIEEIRMKQRRRLRNKRRRLQIATAARVAVAGAAAAARAAGAAAVVSSSSYASHLSTRTSTTHHHHHHHHQMPLTFIHPAFRRFFRRPVRKSLKRRWNNKLSLAIRIKNRYLRYRPLPRVAPFYCQKCRFSSYYADTVRNHMCSRRASTVYSFDREEKIAASGFRSKSKNALAVIERAVNPNAFHIPRVPVTNPEPTAPSYNTPSLQVLAYNAISLKRFVQNYPTYAIFTRPKTTHRLYPDHVTRRTDVLYCKYCKQLYYDRRSWQKHFKLPQSQCKIPEGEEDLIHVQCRGDSCIPAEYEYGRRECLVQLQSIPNMRCTACGILSRQFSSIGDFHKHLFECDGLRTQRLQISSIASSSSSEIIRKNETK